MKAFLASAPPESAAFDPAAVEFDRVTKAFGSHQVLKELSFTVKKGEIVSLLGPNGAGKTTAISLMLHLLRPGSGRIRVFGLAPGDSKLRQRVGAMLQDVKAPDGLKTGEVIRLFRSYYRSPLPYERLMDMAGLHREESRMASALSGGQRRRLAFALCMAGNPDLVVLDEPTAGMDVEARLRFWEVIRALKSDGKTILLTTHHLEEADAVSDRITVLMDGKIAAQGSPAELKSSLALRTISFRLTGLEDDERGDRAMDRGVDRGMDRAVERAAERFARWDGVERAETSGGRIILYARETDALLSRLMAEGGNVAGGRITDLEVNSATLEAAFRAIVEGGRSGS
jgi:ABC-2 type transport system ATP-binding protein